MFNVHIQGNVGADPETKVFQNNSSVTNLNVAVSQGHWDTNAKKWVDHNPDTVWVRVQAWQGRLQTLVEQNVHKGMTVDVTGALEVQYYTDKNGEEQIAYQLNARTISIVPRQQQQSAGAAQAQANRGGFNQQPPQTMPQSPYANNSGADPWDSGAGFGSFDTNGDPEF